MVVKSRKIPARKKKVQVVEQRLPRKINKAKEMEGCCAVPSKLPKQSCCDCGSPDRKVIKKNVIVTGPVLGERYSAKPQRKENHIKDTALVPPQKDDLPIYYGFPFSMNELQEIQKKAVAAVAIVMQDDPLLYEQYITLTQTVRLIQGLHKLNHGPDIEQEAIQAVVEKDFLRGLPKKNR